MNSQFDPNTFQTFDPNTFQTYSFGDLLSNVASVTWVNGDNKTDPTHVFDNIVVSTGGGNSITGAGGDEILVGGAGDDTLTGGGGDDLFVFAPDSGDDTITDFDLATDALSLAGGLGLDATDPFTELDFNDDDVLDTKVTFDSGDTVTLLGVTGVTEGDLFVF